MDRGRKVDVAIKFQKIAFSRLNETIVHRLSGTFFRILSLVWILKGLAGWSLMLGLPLPLMSPFEALSTYDQSMVLAFSLIDIVAGVSLWLSPHWGGVVLLLSIIAESFRQLHAQPTVAREISLAIIICVGLLYVMFRYVVRSVRQNEKH